MNSPKRERRRAGVWMVMFGLIMTLFVGLAMYTSFYVYSAQQLQNIADASSLAAIVATRADSDNQDVQDEIALLMARIWPNDSIADDNRRVRLQIISVPLIDGYQKGHDTDALEYFSNTPSL